MKEIPDKSISCIICDLPFGVTNCKWDTIIPLDKLWYEYKRIVKDNTPIVLFGTEPFSSTLRVSNKQWYRYDWIWKKERGSNWQNCKYQPMKNFENIMVFSKKKHVYNPIFWYSKPYHTKEGKRKNRIEGLSKSGNYANHRTETINKDGKRYPLATLEFKRDSSRLHPTQKPIDLLEYLIKTYSTENDIILDNCIGSGSTCIAAINTNRHFIGIELLEKYVNIANKRIENAYRKRKNT